MRWSELAKRNLREVWRDPLSLGLTLGLPILMLVVLQAFESADAFFSPTSLVPGVALFGFVMLMFSAAMTLSRDRENALFSRLVTTPLSAWDFVAAYALPYVLVAVIQTGVLFGIGAIFGLEIQGSIVLVALVLLVMALFFVGMGMISGALFTLKQVPFVYMIVLLLTIFGGAWMDLDAIGGVFRSVGDWFPFAHALDAARDVMLDGAGFGAISGDVYWTIGYALVIAALAGLSMRRSMIE